MKKNEEKKKHEIELRFEGRKRKRLKGVPVNLSGIEFFGGFLITIIT